MNRFQKKERFVWICIAAAIVIGIALGIAGQNRDLGYEKTMVEKVIKLVLVLILVLAALLYWLLPKTKLAKHFKMNDTLFVITCIIGMICGISGLAVTFVWQQLVIETHLFEFILIPLALIYVYWAIIMKIRKTSDMLDEKQIYNMTRAAATTLMGATCVMLLMYFVSYQKIFALEGKVWFLFYFFVTLLFYSASTLFYFKYV